MTRIRRFAQREPLITRQLIVYTVSAAGWLAARYFGVELDTEATVLLLLSVVGLAAGVAREGVTPAKKPPAAPVTIEVGSPATGNATLRPPPDVAHTVTDPAPPPPPRRAGLLDADTADTIENLTKRAP